MTTLARARQQWKPGLLRWLALAALAAAAWHLAASGFAGGDRDLRPMPVVAAAALYLGSHVVRAVRLGLLLLFERPSIRMVFGVHFATSWLSAAIPLKLGEVARAAGLMGLARQPATGLAAYVVEKFLDAVVLLALVAAVAVAGGVAPAQGLLAAVLLLLVAVGAAAYFSARGLIGDVRLLLVGDSRSKRGVRALALLQFLDFAHASLRAMMHGRVALLLLLTAVVWSLDIAAFLAIAAAAGVPALLPGDFLQTLQSMLDPSARLPSAAPYAWMIGVGLAGAAVPAAITILCLARREIPAHPRWRRSTRHKRYSNGELDAPDH